MALLFVGLGCSDLPSLEGTRCDPDDSPCPGELRCVAGRCLALTGGPLLCDSNAQCASQDPRRPYCVGTGDDDSATLATLKNNFCAGCGADADCEDAVCVLGEAAHYCIGCLAHEHCDTGRCDKNVCKSCKSDAQCARGSCLEGRCVDCAAHSDCGANTHLCLEGVCRACRGDDDCGAVGPGWRCHERRCAPAGGHEK